MAPNRAIFEVIMVVNDPQKVSGGWYVESEETR